MKRTGLVSGCLRQSFLICCLFSSVAVAGEFSWSSATHETFEADFNQDGHIDLLLQAKTAGHKHYFIAGQAGAKSRYDYSKHFELPKKLANLHWTADKVQLLPIKLKNKEAQGLLVLPKHAEKALLFTDLSRGADLEKASQVYELKQNKWLKDSEAPFYHAGDFDGDGQQDLLQLDAEKGAHQVILFEKNQKLKIAKKLTKAVRWGLKNSERLIIGDFNQDGRDDVFALSRDGAQSHVLLYSNGKGGFSQEDGKFIPTRLAHLQWADNASGIAAVRRKSDNQTVLFRAYNNDERDKATENCLGWVYDTETDTAKEYCPVVVKAKNTDAVTQSSDVELNSCPIEMSIGGDVTTMGYCDDYFITPDTPTVAPQVSYGPHAPGAQINLVLANTGDYSTLMYEVSAQDANGVYSNLAGVSAPACCNNMPTVSVKVSLPSPGTYSLMYRACHRDGCSGFGPAATVLIQTPPAIHTVSATAESGGAISPASRRVPKGQITTFTVTPNAGYIPAALGCDGTLSGTIYTTGVISGDCTVKASFTHKTYRVSTSAGPNGSISPTFQDVPHGQRATFTLTPDVGYIPDASGCDGILSGTIYTTGVITGDCTVRASFTQQTHRVSTSAGANGSISPTFQDVPHGQSTTFTVTPNAGYIPAASGCDGILSGTIYTTGVITGDCTVKASFTQQTHRVSTSAGANGSISPTFKDVPHGQRTTFTVTPNAGYIPSASGCDGILSGTIYTTGVITGDCTVRASFTQQTHRVSTSAGANGSISPTFQDVPHGQTTTFTVTPNAGYTAAASGCGGGLSGTTYTTGVITGACTVSATFTQSTSNPDPVTKYEYDARGRLVKLHDNLSKSTTYVLDHTGNRLSVSDQTAPVLAPKITSFEAPREIAKGGTATIRWTSQDSLYCALAIFGDNSAHSNLAATGSLSLQLYEDTGITLSCYYGSLSAVAGKNIRIKRFD